MFKKYMMRFERQNIGGRGKKPFLGLGEKVDKGKKKDINGEKKKKKANRK